jgi:hypothetical protein
LIVGLARAGSCHTRATRVRFAQFFACSICHRISQGSLPVTRGVQVDQSRSAAGMAQAVHQFTVCRRISFDTDNRTIEISDAEYPADRTELRFITPLKPWTKLPERADK